MTLKKLVRVLGVITILVGTGYLLVRDRLINPADIQIVSQTGSSSLASCGTISLTLNDACGQANFRTASFTCADGVASKLIAERDSCRSVEEWDQLANTACAGKCIPIATTIPSPIPTHSPSNIVCEPCYRPEPDPNYCREGQIKEITDRCGCTYHTCTAQPPIKSPTPTKAGCFYKQVQCFKAPCEPILICPLPD